MTEKKEEQLSRAKHIRNGICFCCSGKYNRYHKCPPKKMFMISNEEENVLEEVDDEIVEEEAVVMRRKLNWTSS